MLHGHDWSVTTSRFDRQIKFYDTVESAGTWIFREPINDSWSMIRVCVTIYFLILVIWSFAYSSSNLQYNHYWLGIYSEWILLLNTVSYILCTACTLVIWYKHKYPHNNKYVVSNLRVHVAERRFNLNNNAHHKRRLADHQLLFHHDDDDEEDDAELQYNHDDDAFDAEKANINLHSDTDLPDNEEALDEEELLKLQQHALNEMKLRDISYPLSLCKRVSDMILQFGLSASLLTALSYWLMVEYDLENTNDDTDWMVTILNIQYYIFVVCIMLFVYYASFVQLNYFVGALYILLFDGVFCIFILFFEIFDKAQNGGITLMGRHTVNDEFNFELLAWIFIFMSVHLGIHLFLTFSKNVFLMQYLKLLKYFEVMAKINDLPLTHMTILQIMDPLDFELIAGENFEYKLTKKLSKHGQIGGDDESDDDIQANKGAHDSGNDTEGSDVGYSSHDFNHNDKLWKNQKGSQRKNSLRTKYQEIIKKKWNAIKKHDFQMLNTVKTMNKENSLMFGGGKGIGKARNNSVRIVFGSNIHQRFRDMPAVRAITTYSPNIVMFLGNTIYLDETPRKLGLIKTKIEDDTTFNNRMNSMFNFWKVRDIELDPSTEYQRLLKHKDFILCNPDDTLPAVLATWDEHDYGGHNQHSRYQNKYHSKSAFTHFLDLIDMKHELTPYIDKMRSKTYRGIFYHYDYHHVFDEDDDVEICAENQSDSNEEKKEEQVTDEEEDEEKEEEKREEEKAADDDTAENPNHKNHLFIRFIMLDLKFDRNADDMFGREQWHWLKKILSNTKQRKDKPDWHIFGFGTPCFVEQFDLEENMKPNVIFAPSSNDKKQFKLPNLISPIPAKSDFKEWDFLSRRKFLMLLDEVGIADRTLFMSGNMCYSQVLKHNDYGIYEFVASSLTHSISSMIPNDYYVKDQYENSSPQTDVSNCCGYGYLEIDKKGWRFCVNDANGTVHIPLSKRF